MSFARLLDPIKDRLRVMFSRAVILLTDDSGEFQELQISALADETLDGVESFGLYGVYSRPKVGAEAIIGCVGGVRSHAVVIATHDRRYRLTGLAEGDVALADDQGQVLQLGRNGISVVTTLPIRMQGASLAIACDTTITGKLTVTEDVALQGALDVTGTSTLGEGATLPVKLSDDSAATKVKAK
jgi:phage baseplate assembly protein V